MTMPAESTARALCTVQNLDAERFALYGGVLAVGRPMVPELSSGHWSIELVVLPDGFGAGAASTIARHFSYDQVFIGIVGRTHLVVAPATSRDSVAPDGPIEAFALQPGDTVLVRRGTWHTTIPAAGGSSFVNITRRDAHEFPGALGDAGRAYVNTVELAPPLRLVDHAGGTASDHSLDATSPKGTS